MSRIQKLLVSNRGEIAVRILRAARGLGMATVSVYADQDRGAPHVALAQECFPLGGRIAQETYLDIQKILAVAHRSGADAVHPGYGFLAENAAFAEAVTDEGLRFVGPPPDVLRLAGNKLEARAKAEKAGVPVLPCYRGPIASFRREAPRIGFPLLIKAAAGGGGRGIRRLEDARDVERVAEAASREAANFFGHGEVYLEREVPRARHVEFQILADQQGKIVQLSERDCSIQRRHQKIIEESPSPALDDVLRQKMADAAVRVAREVKYENAGTVEFLLETDPRGRPGEFYFLEINARLQVEHPVTEVLTGEDLVEWQLRIASGESLPDTLEEAAPRNHAIECRICAENPPKFFPSAGVLLRLDPPTGAGIRFDAGYAQGDSVPQEFDSLLGKVIAHGKNRSDALRRMISALESAVFLGVETNQDFLVDVLAHPAFQAGSYTTAFLREKLAHWKKPEVSDEVRFIARAAFEHHVREGATAPVSPGPWEQLGGWQRVARKP